MTAQKQEIYTVTTVNEMPRFDRRCFGFFHSKIEAIAAVEENRCDMHECYYQYLVIENFMPQIHPIGRQVQWYRWDGDEWKACEMPKQFEGTINYAIG